MIINLIPKEHGTLGPLTTSVLNDLCKSMNLRGNSFIYFVKEQVKIDSINEMSKGLHIYFDSPTVGREKRTTSARQNIGGEYISFQKIETVGPNGYRFPSLLANYNYFTSDIIYACCRSGIDIIIFKLDPFSNTDENIALLLTAEISRFFHEKGSEINFSNNRLQFFKIISSPTLLHPLEREIAKKESQISQLTETLTKEINSFQELSLRLEKIQSEINIGLYDRIAPMIFEGKDITFARGILIITTVPLVMRLRGGDIPMGRYTIRIPLSSSDSYGDLTISSHWNTERPHPHADRNGHICLGAMSVKMARSVALIDIEAILAGMIKAVESYNHGNTIDGYEHILAYIKMKIAMGTEFVTGRVNLGVDEADSHALDWISSLEESIDEYEEQESDEPDVEVIETEEDGITFTVTTTSST
jgi:hypothetical protein